jgi:hypothetical protein
VEAGLLQETLIFAGRAEKVVADRTAGGKFVMRNGAGDDERVAEKKTRAGLDDAQKFAEEGETAGNVTKNIVGQRAVEGGVGEGQWRVGANQGLAWQFHFRQKPGKPNAIKSYHFGINGPSYSVGLKGRAWISADRFEIVRMETDIVAPVPQIKLLAEHTLIEYGPVNFRQDNVNLWLPQSAEVYFAWRGRQMHRRHSFSNYLLFGVDEKEHIGAPKNAEPTAQAGPPETNKTTAN